MKKLNFCFMFVLACGDNLRPAPDAPPRPLPNPGMSKPDMGTPEAAVDAAALDAEIDAPGLSTAPYCCVGALNGNTPIECGPPKGKCTRFACDGVELLVCRGN